MNTIHKELLKQKHPNFPVEYLPKGSKSNSPANALTKAIKDYCALKQAHVERINTQGQYNEALGKWTKSHSTKGSADLHGCYKGRAFYVEVKYGKDRMSAEQVKYRETVEKAGAKFFIAKNIDSFIADFNAWIKEI